MIRLLRAIGMPQTISTYRPIPDIGLFTVATIVVIARATRISVVGPQAQPLFEGTHVV
jgi:hypothetical protein